MRRISVAAACLFVLACASQVGPRRVLYVSVESQHWYAKTVRVYCESGHQIGTLRGLVTGQTDGKRFFMAGCEAVRLVVEAVGGEVWASEHIMVEPGDTIRLRIGPTLALSSYSVRDP